MRVVAFNGSARKGGNTSQMLRMALDEIEAEGIETELVELSGKRLQGCMACYKCGKVKTGRCAIEDDPVNEYIEKMVAADGILLGSPTYFADLTAGMKALIERAGMVTRANGNLLRRKVGAGVVAVRRCGAYHVFSSLNAFFLIGEMVVVGSSYWNMGLCREVGEFQKDEEGLKTMRDLGRNVAWTLKRLNG